MPFAPSIGQVQLDLFSSMRNFERNNVLAPHRCGAYPIADRGIFPILPFI